MTCPRASKGVDSRVVPCKPASHQEPGTGSATRDSSLNINSSWDLRVCRMERCRLLKGNKVIGMLQSQLLHCNIANSCTSQGSWHSCGCRWRYKSGLLRMCMSRMHIHPCIFADCFSFLLKFQWLTSSGVPSRATPLVLADWPCQMITSKLLIIAKTTCYCYYLALSAPSQTADTS